MKAIVDGVEYLLGFKHLNGDLHASRGTSAIQGVRFSHAKRVVQCLVWKRLPTLGVDNKPTRVAVVQTAAICSASEPINDPEFGRQLALARALAKLPREVAGPLLGAYLNSAPRKLVNLGTCTVDPFWQKPGRDGVVKWRSLRDALHMKQAR